MPPAPKTEPIPGLPFPNPGMNWRSLNRFRDGHRGEEFYLACLQYAQRLWLDGLPARAILCLDRAWGADLGGDDAVLEQWPLPYAPLTYLLIHAPSAAFLGNPRVHFQHYADRLGEPRRLQRMWRSWAGWAIVRNARPDFPGDPRHRVQEPTLDQIESGLSQHGHPGEPELWKEAFVEDATRL